MTVAVHGDTLALNTPCAMSKSASGNLGGARRGRRGAGRGARRKLARHLCGGPCPKRHGDDEQRRPAPSRPRPEGLGTAPGRSRRCGSSTALCRADFVAAPCARPGGVPNAPHPGLRTHSKHYQRKTAEHRMSKSESRSTWSGREPHFDIRHSVFCGSAVRCWFSQPPDCLRKRHSVLHVACCRWSFSRRPLTGQLSRSFCGPA